MGSWGFLIVETFSAIWMADVEPEGRFLQKPQARKERVAFQGSGDALDWLVGAGLVYKVCKIE